MNFLEEFGFFIYLITTVAGIIAFWYNLKRKVDVLSAEMKLMEKSLEELKVSRLKVDDFNSEESSMLKTKLNDLDKAVVKLSTQIEVQNKHIEIMLDLLIKRIEKVERI